MKMQKPNIISTDLYYLAAPYSHPDSTVRAFRLQIVNRIAFELHKQRIFVYSPLAHNLALCQLWNTKPD